MTPEYEEEEEGATAGGLNPPTRTNQSSSLLEFQKLVKTSTMQTDPMSFSADSSDGKNKKEEEEEEEEEEEGPGMHSADKNNKSSLSRKTQQCDNYSNKANLAEKEATKGTTPKRRKNSNRDGKRESDHDDYDEEQPCPPQEATQGGVDTKGVVSEQEPLTTTTTTRHGDEVHCARGLRRYNSDSARHNNNNNNKETPKRQRASFHSEGGGGGGGNNVLRRSLVQRLGRLTTATATRSPSFRMTPVKVASVRPLEETEEDKQDELQRKNQGLWTCCPRSAISVALPIFFALSIVFLLYAGKTNDGDNKETEATPMAQPLWQALENVSGIDVYDASTARGRAAHWLLVEDNFATRATRSKNGTNANDSHNYSDDTPQELHPLLLQRYLLALLYHSTTPQENETWYSCGQLSQAASSSSSSSSSCRHPVISGETQKGQNDKTQQEQQRTTITTTTMTSTSWLSLETNECTWFGVDCTLQGHVVGLNLENNNLHGTLPPELHLLSELQLLNLRDNSLTGSIPASYLWESPQLQVLDLAHNALTKRLPQEPKDATTTMSSSLQVLSLTDNLLEGPLPSWLGQDLLQLTTLQLDFNAFTGSIPTTLGQLQRLDLLRLNNNQLQHGIPSELGSLQHLQVLALQENSALGGIIPFSLGNLTGLRELFLSGLGLSGPLPESLYQLSQLEQFQARDNSLTGPLLETVGQLQSLRQWDVRRNALTGVIPASFAQLPQLEKLWLHYNFLGGTMPSAICQRVQQQENAWTLEELSSDCTLGSATPQFFVSCPCCTLCCDASLAAQSRGDGNDDLCVVMVLDSAST